MLSETFGSVLVTEVIFVAELVSNGKLSWVLSKPYSENITEFTFPEMEIEGGKEEDFLRGGRKAEWIVENVEYGWTLLPIWNICRFWDNWETD